MNQIPDFDPYQLLLRRKQQSEDPTEFPTIEYNVEDVAALEEFCKQHNIISFNFKHMI